MEPGLGARGTEAALEGGIGPARTTLVRESPGQKQPLRAGPGMLSRDGEGSGLSLWAVLAGPQAQGGGLERPE